MLEESISSLSSIRLPEVRYKNALVNDVALIGHVALSKKRETFSELSLEVLRPVKPMTAITSQSVGEINREFAGLVSYEFKPDGIRVQIHKVGEKVRFFDRKLKDISHLLPNLRQRIVDDIKMDSAVLEGELICRDAQGRPRPYDVLIGEMRSREMRTNSTPKTPLDLELFEVLHLNGQDLMDVVYNQRRKILSETSERIPLINQMQTNDPVEANEFFAKAIEHGYEGLIAKHLHSTYVPGIRTRFWAKIRESSNNLDLVIMSVYPPSRKGDTCEAYLLGSRDLRSNRFIPVAKCRKGLSSKERRWLNRRLESVTLERTGKGRFVLPRVVLEVSFKNIRRDLSLPGGYWLVSPKATRVRIDKSPKEIDSLQWIQRLAETNSDL